MIDAILIWISRLWYGSSDGDLEIGERGLDRSTKWPTVRKQHLNAEPRCQWCNTKWALNVHHCIPFHLDPTKELDPTNLITLCELPSRNCHFRRGHKGNWKNCDLNIRTECEQHREKERRTMDRC